MGSVASFLFSFKNFCKISYVLVLLRANYSVKRYKDDTVGKTTEYIKTNDAKSHPKSCNQFAKFGIDSTDASKRPEKFKLRPLYRN